MYQFLDEMKPDILMLQETKIRRMNLTKDVGTVISQGARSKNCVEGRYLAGGLATIARKGLIMKKDQRNTSEFILVTELLVEYEEESSTNNDTHTDKVKLINVYFQPNNALEVEERLLSTVHQIRQAEPEALIVIGGDFNQELTEPNNKVRPQLEQCNMKVGMYQGNSFFRPNM